MKHLQESMRQQNCLFVVRFAAQCPHASVTDDAAWGLVKAMRGVLKVQNKTRKGVHKMTLSIFLPQMSKTAAKSLYGLGTHSHMPTLLMLNFLRIFLEAFGCPASCSCNPAAAVTFPAYREVLLEPRLFFLAPPAGRIFSSHAEFSFFQQ